MPLTARCHTLRPDKNSGWLVYFELVPRGPRDATFLVVGPEASDAPEHRAAALRAGQAAVRYLKDVPAQAPPKTLLEATARILLHEAGETGTALEFGCGVLEADRLWVLTAGTVGLVPLAPTAGLPERPATPAPHAVRSGNRCFLGRVPLEATPEELTHLETREGGAGGLVMEFAPRTRAQDSLTTHGPELRTVRTPSSVEETAAPAAQAEPSRSPEIIREEAPPTPEESLGPSVEVPFPAPAIPVMAESSVESPPAEPPRPYVGPGEVSRPHAVRRETRGLGFWLAVVSAGLAIGILLWYLLVFRGAGPAKPTGMAVATREHTGVDSASTARPDTAAVASPGRVKWETTFTQPLTSSPAVAGDRIVFGCRDGRVYALDRAEGRRLWAYAASAGFGSSPAVVGETVVIGGYDGHVYGLDVATGEERWNVATGDRVVASPAVDSLYAYVGSYDHYLYCIEIRTGKVRWRRDLGVVLWSSPALGQTLLVVAGFDGTVTALAPATGEIRWRARTEGKIYSSPALGPGMVFVGSEDQHLYGLDLATGRPVWKLAAGGAVNGSPAYCEGRVVVGTDTGVILCADAGNGTQVWRVATGGEVRSRPVVAGSLVWVTGYDGVLRGIRWLTGREEASFPTDSSTYASPAVVEGIAYFGAMDGRFLAVDLGIRPT